MNASRSATSRLIFSGRAWHQLRPLLLDAGLYAVGELQERDAVDCRELLVAKLSVGRELPDGSKRAPLEQWVTVMFDHDENQTPESLLRQIRAKRSQRIVAVVLRDSDTATCQAALLENDSITPLDELRVNGPGMLRLSRIEEPPINFAHGSNVRWSRTGRRVGRALDVHVDIRLLLPGEGCVACVGGLDDPQRRLYDVAAPAGALTRGRRTAWHEQRAGSLITINGLTVSTAVQSWLDLCSGHLSSSYWHRLEWQRGQGIGVDQGAVRAAPECPFCAAGG
jgi:hypothetical protein